MQKVTRNGAAIADYRYLYDGTKLNAMDSRGEGLEYHGPLTYRMGKDGSVSLSEARFAGGRFVRLCDAEGDTMEPVYTFTDHLGSVRAQTSSGGDLMEHDNYLPFGTRWDDGSPTDPDNRYRFSGKEEQSFTGLPYIDYGARMYDPCTARWLSQDPLAEKYCSVSPYAFCNNNPVNIIDPDGMDWYIFSSSGQYMEKVKMEGQHRIAIHSTETLESGDTYDHYRFVDFADPENDPQSIDNGEIDKITEISEDEIYNQLTNQGVSNASMIDFYKESGGGGAFDYYATVISTHYSDPNSRLYLPKGENIAHNAQNYGNFLWGITGHIIGFPTIILRMGAHYNSYFDPHKGNGYEKQWDSKDDQLSIKKGALYAKKHKLKKR